MNIIYQESELLSMTFHKIYIVVLKLIWYLIREVTIPMSAYDHPINKAQYIQRQKQKAKDIGNRIKLLRLIKPKPTNEELTTKAEIVNKFKQQAEKFGEKLKKTREDAEVKITQKKFSRLP